MTNQTHTRARTHVHTRTHTYTHAHTLQYMHAHFKTCMCTQVNKYTPTYQHVVAHTHTHTRTHTHTNTPAHFNTYTHLIQSLLLFLLRAKVPFTLDLTEAFRGLWAAVTIDKCPAGATVCLCAQALWMTRCNEELFDRWLIGMLHIRATYQSWA